MRIRKIFVAIACAVAGAALCCVAACGGRHHVTASAEGLRLQSMEMHSQSIMVPTSEPAPSPSHGRSTGSHVRSRRAQASAAAPSSLLGRNPEKLNRSGTILTSAIASSPSHERSTGGHVRSGGGHSKTQPETLTGTLTKTLTDNIFRITAGARGEIGVAVIAGSDTVVVNDSCVYPLMSVFKVHQALAVCERLDREGRPLDTLLTFRRRDLDPATWSPMMKDHPEPSLTMPVATLLRYSLVQSDNNASNLLFSRLVNVHETDSFIATLIPRARFRITYAESEMAADHAKAYGNRTSPLGAAMLMDKLFTGSVVSREKQDFITECLYGCATGSDRISAPLLGKEGVTIAHKTGSGYTDNGVLAACNDVAFIQLPGGAHYALAIFIKDFHGDERQAARIMSRLSATVYRHLSRHLTRHLSHNF